MPNASLGFCASTALAVHNTGTSMAGDAVVLMYKKRTGTDDTVRKNARGETLLPPLRELIGFERVQQRDCVCLHG